VGDRVVPIVPGAILFDLINGGDKDWVENPYKPLGAAALAAASQTFSLGSEGAGTGALIADMKGGLGSASAVINGVTVGALVAVNALGRVTVGNGPRFWAAPFEIGDEFGGHGMAQGFDPTEVPLVKGGDAQNTTIAIVATDAALTQAQATRMAIAAHDGMARAIYPSHTPMDGDLVFAAATGAVPLADPVGDPLMIGHVAALCLARAIARGVHAATARPGDAMPSYGALHG
jgi:D-aminopeptidase